MPWSSIRAVLSARAALIAIRCRAERGEGASFAIREIGRFGQIDPDPYHHPLALPFQQDAGKLGAISGQELAAAITEYEAIEEILGRVMSYAQLVFSGDAEDPANGRFYQTMQERATTISSHLIFFTLELNRLEDAVLLDRAESGVQRQHRGVAQVEAAQQFSMRKPISPFIAA